MRLLPLLVAFLFAFCVLQGVTQPAYGEETIVIENDLFFKDSGNDITVTGTWLAEENEFLLSVELEQVSLTMNLDLNGDKGKKGNGITDWGTTWKPKEDIKREKIHNIGTCPIVPRHTTRPQIKNGTCKPRVPGFTERTWSMASSAKKQGGLAAGKVLYGLRMITGKGWNAGVMLLDFGAMVVATECSVVETTIDTVTLVVETVLDNGTWLAGEVFDGGKYVVDLALDVGRKGFQKVRTGFIYLRDFAMMVYEGHIEGYLLMIRDMPWDEIWRWFWLVIGVTLLYMFFGYLWKKLRKPPKRILSARMSPAGRRRPINTSRRRTS